jgi:hypothetical protein
MERTLPIPRRVHSRLSVLPRVARLPIVLVSLLFVAVLQAGAQDKEALIREALSAAPPEVAKTAIVKNWDGTVLKPGTGDYTCYPTRDSMKKRGKMSMCLDKTWQAWADAWQNKKPFKANEVGIAYMLAGDVGSSNTDPYADAPTSNNQWVEPGPHLMVVVPDPAALQGISARYCVSVSLCPAWSSPASSSMALVVSSAISLEFISLVPPREGRRVLPSLAAQSAAKRNKCPS